MDAKTILNEGEVKENTPIESPPLIAGWDASGVVEGVGSGVSLFKPGDEVYFAGTLLFPSCLWWLLLRPASIGTGPSIT